MTLWDESTRPQVTRGGDGNAVGRHLVDVHDVLRAELEQVRALVDRVREDPGSAGAARDAVHAMTMRQNEWTLGAYCASYCRLLTQHHGLEDAAVFPHLRRSDAALAPVLDRLEQEHEVIAEVLDGLDRALVQYIGDPSDVSRLQDAVDLLTEALLSHLAYEEQQLVAPLSRHGFYPGQV